MPSARVEVLLQRCTGEDAPADCVEPGQEVRARCARLGFRLVSMPTAAISGLPSILLRSSSKRSRDARARS